MKVKATSAQSCHHSIAKGLLNLLRRIDLNQCIRVATPMESIERHIAKWRQESDRWKSTQSFRITMELLLEELEKHDRVEIVTCPTNMLREEFDDRFTETFICTDPDRWLPSFDKTNMDAIRKIAKQARSLLPPRVELSSASRGIIIHDREMTTCYEGYGNKVMERIFDNAKMEDLKNYHRTDEYFTDDTHPYTWEYLNTFYQRTLIWRMRCRVLPVGDFVEDTFEEGDIGLNGYCACSVEGDEHIETIGHMLLECELYNKIRTRFRGKHFRIPKAPTEQSVRLALGWVPEVEFPPDGLLKKRKKQARKAITTALAIWRERNIIRSRLGFY